MKINVLWLSTAWKGIFATLCAAALVLDFGFLKGRADLYILNYYTVLSNLACLVFFAFAFAAGMKALRAGVRDFAWRPRA